MQGIGAPAQINTEVLFRPLMSRRIIHLELFGHTASTEPIIVAMFGPKRNCDKKIIVCNWSMVLSY